MPGNPTCSMGQTLPAKKGQVYFGRFYLGKRRAPAVVPFLLQHVDHQLFSEVRGKIANL